MRVELSRRLAKAWKGLAASAVLVSAACIGAGLAWNAGLFGAASAAEARNGAVHDIAAARAEQQAFTEIYLAHEQREVRVAPGESLAGLLSRAGASQNDASAAIASIASVYDPRQLQPGQPISLDFRRQDTGGARLTGIAFRADPGASVTANLLSSGGFAARQVQMPLNFEIARISAPVDTSLYASALARGATDREIASLAGAFGYDVDFQRDVLPGDHFELVFERFYDDEGHTVRTGDLLFIALDTRHGPKRFYAYEAPGDHQTDWYDADGHSARRFLMKTPVNGARLASGFGMRVHPVLGYSLMHRGADFAAPIGTPIMAAGDGVVERAGPFSTYGNYVKLRHGSDYETAYAHLSRFAPGIKAGARVTQGEIIGYVGMSGRATGPHLHYEVLKDGDQVNPMGLRVANGRNLAGRDLELFQSERARIDTLRQARDSEAPGAIEAAAPEQGGLRDGAR